MQNIIHNHNISIKIFDEKPDIKFNVAHTDEGEMIVTPKETSEWKKHSIMQGKITINNYSQLFFIHCDIWNLTDYINQWKMGLNRIDQHNQSCLVTKIHNVKDSISKEWWLLYKINNTIHMQYRLFVDDIYGGKKLFTPDTCYDFIPEYKEHEEDGEKIPEIIVQL